MSHTITSTLTLESLQKRQENALKIEAALLLAQQGKKIDLSRYLKTFDALQAETAKNKVALQNRNIQVPNGFKEKFIEHSKLIQRIEKIAKTIQKAETQPIPPSEMKTPWEGKLHKGETPLHWAVRHHNHALAWQLSLKNHSSIDSVDDLGVSPIDEAILQKDPQMIECLLHPWFVFDAGARANFLLQIYVIKTELNKIRQVDVSLLSPVCQAAYRGNLKQLQEYQNQLDSPDPKTGLTPLHYAILGNHQDVAAFLILNGPNFHFLTPQGHSYLDYAILMGNGNLFAFFNNLHLPFRLAPEEKKFFYLLATGTLISCLKLQAAARDPIRGGGKDQNFLGLPLNAVWTVSKLASKVTGTSNWLGSILGGVESLAYEFNRGAVGPNQALELLPKWMGVAFGIYALSQLTIAIGSSIGKWVPQFLVPTSFTNASSAISSLTHIETMQTALNIASHAYTALRFAGAVKPVLDRIPAYLRTFPSRKFEVLKKAGADLFNIGSQFWMSFTPLLSATRTATSNA